MLATSTAGARTGKSPTLVSRVISGRPDTQTATSVDVPPMSKVRMRSKPACEATKDAPLTPPAGPGEHRLHRRSCTPTRGSSARRRSGRPGAAAGRRRRRGRRGRSSGTSRARGRRTRSSASSRCARTRGTRAGSRTRSRPAGRGRRRRRSRRSRRSWRPFAWALSRQTVSASTPSATSSSTASRTAASSSGSTIAPSAPIRSGTSRT